MKKLIVGVLISLFVMPVFALYNKYGVPDSSEIRKGLT